MVAVISGNGLGLGNTSLAQIGSLPGSGAATVGQGGGASYVNLASGNLVLQSADAGLTMDGSPLSLVRTYNSLGQSSSSGAAPDAGWWSALRRNVTLTGTLDSVGSTVVRQADDGSSVTYVYDSASGHYLSTGQNGAQDTLAWDAGTSSWQLTDGATQSTETYDASGRLVALHSATTGAAYTLSYDAQGRLAQISDGTDSLTLAYDGNGRLSSLSMTNVPPGATGAVTRTLVTYGYDTQGRLTSVGTSLASDGTTSAATYVTSYTYNAAGDIATVTQGDGTTTSYTYDAQGRVTSITVGSGAAASTTTLVYGTAVAGQAQTTVTDAQGRSWRYTYDASGHLVAAQSSAFTATASTADDTAGATVTTTYTYDANGNLTQASSPASTATYTYDASGNLLRSADAQGEVDYTYDSQHHVLTRTTYTTAAHGATPASGAMSAYNIYDASGRLVFSIDPTGVVSQTTYNAAGLATTTRRYMGVLYPVGNLSTTTPPSLAMLTTWAGQQDPGRTARVDLSYDLRGQLAGRTQWSVVDGQGNGVANASTAYTTYVYDAQGLLRQQSTLRGGSRQIIETTTYTYDGLGRLLTTTDPTGKQSSYVYDDAHATIVLTQAGGLVTTEVRDSAGHLLTSTAEDSGTAATRTARALYGSDGRMQVSFDPAGQPTYFFYNGLGQVVATVDAAGNAVETLYDTDGRATGQVAYATPVSTAGWITTGTPPAVGTMPANWTAPAPSANDRTTLSVYDGEGHLVSQTDGVGVKDTQLYDASGRLLVRRGHGQSMAYVYDADGRVAASIDAAGHVTTFTYDAAGNDIRSTVYATALSYLPDSGATPPDLATLQSELVSSPTDRVILNYYDGTGRLVANVDANGFLTTVASDTGANTVTTTRYATALTAAQRAGLTGTESASALVTLVGTAGSQASTATYDADHRVVSSTSPDGTVTTYAYNGAGSLQSTTITPAQGRGQVTTSSATYDAFGEVTSSTTAGHATKTTTYDADGRVKSTTDALGNSTYQFYDGAGRLAYVVEGQPSGATHNALGNVTAFTYTAFGQVASKRQFGGQLNLGSGGLNAATATTAQVTAAVNALASLSNSPDAITTFTYSRAGQLLSVTDALGFQTVYQYTGGQLATTGVQYAAPGAALTAANSTNTAYTWGVNGELIGTTITGTAGISSTSRNFDAFGDVVQVYPITSRPADVTTNTYDGLGQLTSSTLGSLNRTSSATYDAFGRTLTTTDAMGGVTTYAYDVAAGTLSVTTPDGVTMRTTKDAYGNIVSVTNGLGQVTSTTYDADGRPVSSTDAAGNTSSTVYDITGHALTTTDAAGHQIAYTYDADGRVLTRVVDPAGLHLLTTYQYDGQGRELSVTDAGGVLTTFTYDAVGHMLSQVSDAGPGGIHATSTYTYDGEGNVLTATVGAGTAAARTTQYVYDSASPRRLVSTIVDPGVGHLNLTTQYTYDSQGNVLSVTDPNGNTTHSVYDDANEKLFSVSPTGAVTGYTYNADGQVTSTRLYATALSAFTFDAGTTAASVQAAVVTSASDEVSYTVYNADGQARYTVDSNGHVAEMRYDAAGRLVETLRYAHALVLDAPTVTALQAGTFGEAAVASASSQAGNTEATAEATLTVYDAAGRARFVLTQDSAGTQAFVSEVRYDADGRVTDRLQYGTAIAVTPGVALASQFTLASVTSAVASLPNEHSAIVYDTDGRAVFTIDAGGFVTAQSYDAHGNVLRVAAYGTAITLPVPLTAAAVTAALNGATAAQVETMTYDALGRVLTRSNALGLQQAFTYDASGLVLTSADHDGHLTTYTYDAAGRQILVESPAVTVGSYGSDGQLHTSTQHLYTATSYDADGHVLSLAKGAGVDAGHIVIAQANSYAYNALGQRISITQSAPGNVDPVTGAFVPGGTAVVSTIQYDIFGHVVVQTDGNGHSSYSTYDNQGRLAYAVDATGALTSYGYDAFGNRTTVTGHPGQLPIATAGILPGWSPGQPMSQAFLDSIVQSTSPDYLGAGRTTTYTYNQRNECVAETGQSIAYAYATGPLAGSSGQGTPITQYSYDGYGNLVRKDVLIQGSLGQTGNQAPVWATTFTYYNTRNQATMAVDPMGYVTTSSFDAFGRMVANRQYATAIATSGLSVAARPAVPATAVSDRSTVYTYDGAGHLVSQAETGLFSDVGGVAGAATGTSTTTHTYDGEDRVLSTTVNGATTSYAYDAAGRSTTVTEPLRSVLVSNWQALLAANPSLNLSSASLYTTVAPVTTNVYDALGDLLSSTVAAGNLQETTRSYYDAWGRQVMQVDANGNHTFTSYDAVGNITQQSHALTGGNGTSTQVTTTYTYDAVNRRNETRVSRADGSVDSCDQVYYDGLGQVSIRGDATTFLSNAYYANGWLRSAHDAKTGVSHIYVYDLAGRLVEDLYMGTATTEVSRQNVLDLNGNIVRQVAPGASDTTSPLTDPTTLRQFDRWGNVLSLTDADGNITTYQYDALNQVVQETEAGVLVVDEHGGRTVQSPTRQWYYDVDGRLVGTRDENGHTQSIVNDAVGDQVQMTDGTGAVTLTAYDALGRQVAAQNANGAITWQAYNGLNQVTARGDFGATVRGSAVTLQTYVLNENGDRIRVVDALGNATTYVYDSQHRILRSQTALQAVAGVADTYAYDDHGNTIRHTTALGDTATWSYDYFGRVLSHTDLSGASYTYTYDSASGLLTQETSTWKANQTSPGFLASSITQAASVTSYSYYLNGQVKQVTRATGTDVYTYDADGNQTTDTISTIDATGAAVHAEILTAFDSHGRIQSVTTENTDTQLGEMRQIYNYDAAGNRRAVFVQSAFGTNAAPIVLNPGVPAVGTAMGTQFIEVGSALAYTVPATAFTDPLGTGLTYSVSLAGGAPLPAWLSFNAGTHTFVGTAPTSATSYTVAVTAMDALGRTISTTFTLNVSTAKPTFAGSLTPANVVNGSTFSFVAPIATDPNSAVSYTAVYWNGTAYVALPSWITFNASTRTFGGTAPAVGTYTFVLQAVNAYGGFTNLTFAFHSVGHVPSFGGAGAPTPNAIAGQTFSFTLPAATDDDVITYNGYYWNGSSYVALPSWITFNASTRTFSGTAPTSVGNYSFLMQATSSGGAASMQFTFTVNANTPPTFTGTPAPQSIGTGKAFAFSMPGATDPISGVTYYGYLVSGGSYVALPSWVTFNASNLTFSGTAPGSAGTYQFAVIAYNAYGAGTAESTTLTVKAPLPPQYDGVSWIPTSVSSVRPPTIVMPVNTFTNPQGGSLTYSITTNDAHGGFWFINATTGTISVSWSLPVSEVVQVTVKATDPATGLSTQVTANVSVSKNSSAVVTMAAVAPKQQVAAVQTPPPATPNVQAYWFTYDADNRVVVDNGALLGDTTGYHVGITASQGSASTTYDAAGNIKTYTTMGSTGTTATQLNIYDNRNQLVTVQTPNAHGVVGIHETRSYDDNGRLVSDAYYNDAGSTGTGTLNGTAISVDTSGWLSSDVVNSYDADGNLVNKTNYAAMNFQDQINESGSAVQSPSYATAAKTLPVPPPTPPGSASASNADGPLRESQGYKYVYSLEGDVTSEENDTTNLNGQTAASIGYTMSYLVKDSYLAAATVGTGNTGTSTNYYDNDGHLIATQAPKSSGSSVDLVRASAVDASGEIIQRHVYAVDGSSSETDVYAYAAGHALGDVDEVGDFNVLASLTHFANSDSGTQNYVVQVSDTLASIAQAVYGNASFAYIIAAANGLGTNGPATLVAGSTLVIPQVLNAKNTADTFRPYNAMAVLDTPTFQVPDALPVSPEPDDGQSTAVHDSIARPEAASVSTAEASSASTGAAQTEGSQFHASFIRPVAMFEIVEGGGDDGDWGGGGGGGGWEDDGDGGWGDVGGDDGDDGWGDIGGDDGDDDGWGDIGDDDGDDGDVDGSDDSDDDNSVDGSDDDSNDDNTAPTDPDNDDSDLPPIPVDPVTVDTPTVDDTPPPPPPPPDEIPPIEIDLPPPGNPEPPGSTQQPSPPPAPTWPPYNPPAPAPSPGSAYLYSSAPELQPDVGSQDSSSSNASSDPILNGYNDHNDTLRYYNLSNGGTGYGGNAPDIEAQLAAVEASYAATSGGTTKDGTTSKKGDGSILLATNGTLPSNSGTDGASGGSPLLSLPQESQIDQIADLDRIAGATSLTDVFGDIPQYAPPSGTPFYEQAGIFGQDGMDLAPVSAVRGFDSDYGFLSSEGVTKEAAGVPQAGNQDVQSFSMIPNGVENGTGKNDWHFDQWTDYAGAGNGVAGLGIGAAGELGKIGLVSFGLGAESTAAYASYLVASAGAGYRSMPAPALNAYLKVGAEASAADVPLVSGAFNWSKAVPYLEGVGKVSLWAGPIIEGYGDYRLNGQVDAGDIGHMGFSVEVGLALAALGPPGLLAGAVWLAADTYAQGSHYTPVFGEDAGQEKSGWRALWAEAQDNREYNIQAFQQQHPGTSHDQAAQVLDSRFVINPVPRL
jgi:YD repeat-containing protein